MPVFPVFYSAQSQEWPLWVQTCSREEHLLTNISEDVPPGPVSSILYLAQQVNSTQVNTLIQPLPCALLLMSTVRAAMLWVFIPESFKVLQFWTGSNQIEKMWNVFFFSVGLSSYFWTPHHFLFLVLSVTAQQFDAQTETIDIWTSSKV